MSRPREHDERLAEALLDAAEGLIAEDGVDALSLRSVAAAAGTTTRAIYTLFGSKEALVGALGVRAMELLGGEVASRQRTEDPVADVIEAGLTFRRFAVTHPALFSVSFHRASARSWPPFRRAADDAFSTLLHWLAPLAAQGLLGNRSINQAAQQFDALCEGLAWMELRGNSMTPDPEAFWSSTLTALVTGFAAPTTPQIGSSPTTLPAGHEPPTSPPAWPARPSKPSSARPAKPRANATQTKSPG